MDKYFEGGRGEVRAKDYLIDKGYEILATNVDFPGKGELDIVAMDGATLVFVEVRTRSDAAFGNPLETITKGKIKRIVRASRLFLAEHRISCKSYRYDVVAILHDCIEHIPDAFFAKW